MKQNYLKYLCFVFLIATACKQNKKIDAKYCLLQFPKFQKNVIANYKTNAPLAIIYNDSVLTCASLLNNKYAYAAALQNKSFIYKEMLHQKDSAMHYAKINYEYVNNINDTLGKANSLIYLSKLYSENQMTDTAITCIELSKKIFAEVKYEKGIWMAELEKVTILINQNKLTEGTSVLNNVKSFWIKSKDTNNIFYCNNKLLGIYKKVNNKSEFEKIAFDNNLFLEKTRNINKSYIKEYETLIEK